MNKNILNEYKSLKDLKLLSLKKLKIFSDEIREEIIQNIVKNGGHLGSNLGVVELTIALHYIFDAPKDKFIFDIGHQSLTHKILTGRKNFISQINVKNGISTYCSINESPEFDVFGAGHSSTSISAGLGIYHGLKQNKQDNYVIPIIGDSSIASGIAYEALNNLDNVGSNFIIILNDNEMSISKSSGMLYKHLLMLKSENFYKKTRGFVVSIVDKMPKFIATFIKKCFNWVNFLLIKFSNINNIFSHFGLDYIGVVDGHNLDELIKIFKRVKIESKRNKRPVIIHIKTQKGKGMRDCAEEKYAYHSVGRTQKDTFGVSYQNVAGETILKMQGLHDDVNIITPAMQSGSCLTKSFISYKDRCFDVGISEQHALTFAAGLARVVKKPYCFIYSTFLQRSYDQLIHDVVIQSLPVKIIIDRAGIIPYEGPTHQGLLDISILMNMDVIMCSPSNSIDLIKMMNFSYLINDKAFIMRYPKASLCDYDSMEKIQIESLLSEKINIKEFVKIKQLVHYKKSKTCIIAYGDITNRSLAVSNLLKDSQIECDIFDLRFIKPLDTESLNEIAEKYKNIFILEDAYVFGGVGSFLFEYFKKINSNINIHNFGFPIENIPENLSMNEILSDNRIDNESIAEKIIKLSSEKNI